LENGKRQRGYLYDGHNATSVPNAVRASLSLSDPSSITLDPRQINLSSIGYHLITTNILQIIQSPSFRGYSFN